MNRLPANTKAYFIKLGEGGEWEHLCLETGTIRFGYSPTPLDLCVSGDWEGVQEFWAERRKNASTGKNDARQIQTFFEADESAIFVTFAKGYLWWCHPNGVPGTDLEKDGARVRQTVAGWKKTSLGGEPLLVSRLSGKLTRTQMYRGTICEVAETAYLLRRINDEQTPELVAAEATEKVLLDQILAMVRLLAPLDFELMVELIFAHSGWRRQTRTGGSQKTVDLDLLLPTTGERAFVQVKSTTNTKQFDGYADTFAGTDAHARMFYVWHSGVIHRDPPPNITFWGPGVIASKVLEAGLLAWLKDRIS
ncbi:hypothetical protein ACXU4B_10230 [Dyella soli]|uniref:Restriction endonuclease type IV Mrr domain-containing protein n=1 Tax=Dyella soli TaxID=522319 RepID=A0A4R0YXB4_9GAMM|nr:hypothetical protein [Dyella soli]TCI11302.1 hypothetical protein EZM97_21120 [Dyella soli]